nr:Yip1 family protein [uncultured Carboxylicivirga sp.]
MSNDKSNKESIAIGRMYRHLFNRIKDLLFKPAKEWEVIVAEQTTVNDMLMSFSLPLIGAYSLAVFLGYLFGHQELDFTIAVKFAAFTFSACFFALYLGYFILIKLIPVDRFKEEKELAFKLVAYSSLPVYLLGVITALIPQTFFFYFLAVYAAYIIWEGLKVLNFSSEKRSMYTMALTLIVLLLPYGLHKLLIYLSRFAL